MTIAEKLQLIARNVQKVFDGGKQTEREYFWDNATNDNTSWAYRFAGRGWNDKTFRPTVDITMTGSCTATFNGSQITDIVDNMGEHTMIITDVTNAANMFSNSQVTHCPYIELSEATNISYLFSWCQALTTIDGITFPTSTSATVTNAFQGCTALANITVNGKIVISGLDFKQSKSLSVESLRSILGALSLDVSGKSITLSTSHKAVIESDAECSAYASAATSAGWTIAYN